MNFQKSALHGPLPRGWSFNPSSWEHRKRLIPFAAVCLAISLYLALCEVGVIHFAWDPLFKEGTDKVLHSAVARAFPIPDAVIGAFAYILEIILLSTGGDDRWARRPLLVFLSGLVILGLTGASLLLLFLQAVVVHAWCLWCLMSALLTLVLLQRALPEIFAGIQGLVILTRQEGGPLLWLRGRRETKNILYFSRAIQSPFPWTEGTRCPWTLPTALVAGLVVLFLPDLFSLGGVARGVIEFSALLTIASSIISMCEPARPFRWALGAGGFLLFAWLLGEPRGVERWLIGGLGLIIMLLPMHRGRSNGHYGIFSGLIDLR